MRDIIKLGIILFIITSVAAVVLGMSNSLTIGTIQKVEAEISESARKDVLPLANNFEAMNEELAETLKDNNTVLEVFAGYSNDNNLEGYAIKTATPGYGGNVEVITGISLEGKITGIKVVSHQETPGLGANATKPEFQDQYADKTIDKEVVVVKTAPSKDNEIQALAGATISSNAVTDGVNAAREFYVDYLSE